MADDSNYLSESIFYPYRYFTFNEAAKILRVSKYWMMKHAKNVINIKKSRHNTAYVTFKDLELLMIEKFRYTPGINIKDFENTIGYGRQDRDK